MSGKGIRMYTAIEARTTINWWANSGKKCTFHPSHPALFIDSSVCQSDK